MKDSNSFHQKIQEHIDCFATSDPLKEMSVISGEETDGEEASLKWLALAVLHGLNHNAEKIEVSQDADGHTRVMAQYRKTDLPAPGSRTGERIFETMRDVLHFDKKKGRSGLALGVRDSSIMLDVKSKEDGKSRYLTIKFPKES